MWPHVFGIGSGVYMLVLSMTTSIISRPKSDFMNYAIEDLLWSLAIGIVGSVSGRMLARRFPKGL
jgi:hypothetical protein